MPGVGSVEILLVDDDPLDVRLMVETLKRTKLHAHLNVAGDGIEAMAFLQRQGPHSGAPKPDLILLDVNMPRMGGLEVLRQIKEDPALRHIPVVILTTSDSEQDILDAYDSHANCFVTKPVDMPQFTKIVSGIGEFWFTIVKLPANGGPFG
jgi:CheY-like chemotaxis protein